MNTEYCPHCDLRSQAYSFVLEKSPNFTTVADGHPLIEGHILIIPKDHISCIGEYSDQLFSEFQTLYDRTSAFEKSVYGNVSSFEHGRIGQTVFHSHFHFLPFDGRPEDVIPEIDKFWEITKLSEVREVYRADGQYLFFSIGNSKWLVDTSLGVPRFFRDRFAAILGRPERGDWKKMHENEKLMAEARKENEKCKEKWDAFHAASI